MMLPKIDKIANIFKILLSDSNIEPIGQPCFIAYPLYEITVTPDVYNKKKKNAVFDMGLSFNCLSIVDICF